MQIWLCFFPKIEIFRNAETEAKGAVFTQGSNGSFWMKGASENEL